MYLVYILPAMMNEYGQLLSVAQLIVSGYLTLASGRVPLNGDKIDMIRYFHLQPGKLEVIL